MIHKFFQAVKADLAPLIPGSGYPMDRSFWFKLILLLCFIVFTITILLSSFSKDTRHIQLPAPDDNEEPSTLL